jgi:hypothetical protein
VSTKADNPQSIIINGPKHDKNTDLYGNPTEHISGNSKKIFAIRTCSLLAGTVPNLLQEEVSTLVPAPAKYQLKS